MRPLPSTLRRLLSVGLTVAAVAVVPMARAQVGAPTAPAPSITDAHDSPSAADIRQPGGRLVLVLPFDNRSGESNLSWIGDSFPWTLDQRLNSAGFLTIGRDDREYALEHLGLPPDFKPSRATTLRIAQTLDADFVIIGNFTVANAGSSASRIDVQMQVLEVNQLRMSPPITESAPLQKLFDVENSLAWKVARKMDPNFSVAQQTFLAAAGGVGLSTFEDYIRGISAPTQDERLKRLKDAVKASPDYAPALLALGKEEYAARDYDEAAATLAKVPAGDRVALEASYYGGLARFNTARYAEAEKAFAFVALRLPLPEVVNDQGVAMSRQNKDAVALFQQVIATDPNDADYHFNLAVALLGRSDIAGAMHEDQIALKLHPADQEAKDLLARLQATHGSVASLKAVMYADGFDPTTRIRRTWSEASFRQIAFQLDQMRAIQMAALPPHEQAVQYAKLGDGYLEQGLMPEAEQEFNSALAADPGSAAAHAGIAQVRERTGSADEARTEAQQSLKITPNVAAYLVLARLELNAKELSASAADVANALKIDPANSAALGMKTALEARGQSLP
ncbi:MAG TPA: tetratricopeptide repeat protein [Acidobacteriaceae bacterium]|nr:tetratricopeptide repeat protein [Acidobacteriaceae bacterium]